MIQKFSRPFPHNSILSLRSKHLFTNLKRFKMTQTTNRKRKQPDLSIGEALDKLLLDIRVSAVNSIFIQMNKSPPFIDTAETNFLFVLSLLLSFPIYLPFFKSIIIDPKDGRSMSLREKLCNVILNFRVEIETVNANCNDNSIGNCLAYGNQQLMSCSKYSFFITEMKPYSLFHPRLGPMYQRLENLLLEYINQVQWNKNQQPQTPVVRKRLEAWWQL